MKDARIHIRVTAKEKRLIEEKARRYSGGSVSNYIRFCIDNANLQKKTPTN